MAKTEDQKRLEWYKELSSAKTKKEIKERKSRRQAAVAKEFGWRLKRLRAKLKLSQGKMGWAMGLKSEEASVKVIMSRWEAGLHAPGKRFLDRLEELEKEVSR